MLTLKKKKQANKIVMPVNQFTNLLKDLTGGIWRILISSITKI